MIYMYTCTHTYSRFRHHCNRIAARTTTTDVVNLISHGEQCRLSSTKVDFKVIWLLQGCLKLLYPLLMVHAHTYTMLTCTHIYTTEVILLS